MDSLLEKIRKFAFHYHYAEWHAGLEIKANENDLAKIFKHSSAEWKLGLEQLLYQYIRDGGDGEINPQRNEEANVVVTFQAEIVQQKCLNGCSCVGQSKDALPTKFVTKILEIPALKFGVQLATGIYGRVKDFNSITHKSFELAETITVATLTPFAHYLRGIYLAAQPLALHKLDTLAANSLQSLGDKVSGMEQDLQTLMSTSGMSNETRVRVTKNLKGILGSRPVQAYFDVLQFLLNTASKTLDKLLPPCADEEDKQNTHTGEEASNSERGRNFIAQFFEILKTAKNRIGKGRNRGKKTYNAAAALSDKAVVSHDALPLDGDNKDVKTSSTSTNLYDHDPTHGDNPN